MSRGARIGIIVGLVVVLAALFVVLKPSGDDEASSPEAVQTEVPVAGDAGASSDEDMGDMDHESGDHMHTITVTDGEVKGDRQISVPVGTELMLEIKADVADQIHVHGYDITGEVSPGSPAEITFVADTSGTFEVELEGSGLLLTEIEVTP